MSCPLIIANKPTSSTLVTLQHLLTLHKGDAAQHDEHLSDATVFAEEIVIPHVALATHYYWLIRENRRRLYDNASIQRATGGRRRAHELEASERFGILC